MYRSLYDEWSNILVRVYECKCMSLCMALRRADFSLALSRRSRHSMDGFEFVLRRGPQRRSFGGVPVVECRTCPGYPPVSRVLSIQLPSPEYLETPDGQDGRPRRRRRWSPTGRYTAQIAR